MCLDVLSFISTGSFRETLGVKVVKALKRKDDAISHAAVDTLCALMQVSTLYCVYSRNINFVKLYCYIYIP